jgi:benzoate 4-monooxygenase
MIMQLHRKHGDFVRIAPNHISINHPAALAEIYGHKTGFLKADFYDAFVQVEPGLFNTRDVRVHSRKRRYMNPAFSARALSEFEPYMDNELLSWKNQLKGMLDGKQSAMVNFVEWGEKNSHHRKFDTDHNFDS